MTLIFSCFCYTKIEAEDRGNECKLSSTAYSSVPYAMPGSGNVSPSGNDARTGAQYRLPSEEVIRQAGEVTIYDAEAKPVPFKSLYKADDQRKRVMIIFIRHFFCGVCPFSPLHCPPRHASWTPADKSQVCQEYLKALAAGISPTSLPKDVSIVVIGCGAPSLIPSYIENLGFEASYPFPIYADQSRKLYRLFEMQSNLEMPSAPSKYFQRSIFAVVARSAVQMVQRTWHGDAGSGGPISQNGGEILYEVEGDNVEVSWCHKMKNTQDHAEIDELRTVLELDDRATAVA